MFLIRWIVLGIIALFLFGSSSLETNETDGNDNLDEETGGSDQQIEDIWAAEVIERASDRKINDIGSVDTFATGLLAVQAAIYAILIDKGTRIAYPLTGIFIGAIIIAAFNLIILRARDVPRPEAFYNEARSDASVARRDLIAAFFSATERNDRILFFKRLVFWAALAITLFGVVLASWFTPAHDVAPHLFRMV